ncbi:MAG: hypothetical protein JRF21_04320, partial [Deltaproteobacteria bacterium]|nr:hypothetical protein [Deltaproteobacteria bacterium]
VSVFLIDMACKANIESRGFQQVYTGLKIRFINRTGRRNDADGISRLESRWLYANFLFDNSSPSGVNFRLISIIKLRYYL